MWTAVTGRMLCAAAIVLFMGCPSRPKDKEADVKKPAWLSAWITDKKGQPVENPPASITRYQFQGKTVYFYPAPCCDMMSTLFAEDGSVVCRPDGGMTGTGDGGCPTFSAERTDELVIWSDGRQPK